MRAIRKILVAVKEPFARSLPAVDKAVQLARASGASIELYHCITEKVLADPYAEYLNHLADYERETEQRYRVELEALAEKLSKQGLKVRATADWDYPAHDAIVRQARRNGSDLIVAECHAGPRRLAPWLLRLTDWELLKKSPIPVLLVKSPTPWKKPVVLAALDPAHAQAKRAALDSKILQAALTVTDALGGSLEVMHAYEPLPPLALMGLGAEVILPSDISAGSETRAKKLLQDVVSKTAAARAPRHVVSGKATEAIPQVARETGSGIVVMGAVSRSGLKRVFIGNTAELVLNSLTCDVLVVKPPAFKSQVSTRSRGIRYVGLLNGRLPY